MELASEEPKLRFTTAPILAYLDPEVPVTVETDNLDFALGSVMPQKGSGSKLHPIAFHSRKFAPAAMHYGIHDKELVAAVDMFKRWRHYHEGTIHQLQVWSGHQNIEYFTTTKLLHCHHARWAQELASIDSKTAK